MSGGNLFANLVAIFVILPTMALMGVNAASPFPLGFYTWGADIWTDLNSDFLKFVNMPAVKSISPLGNVWFSVGDDANPGVLQNKSHILPFMKAVRGHSKGVLYLTYGDFGTHNEKALLDFIEELFTWLRAQSQSDLQAVAPFGISLDIENAGMAPLVASSLTKLQAYKKKYLGFLPAGHFKIQQVVGGFPDSGTTSFTMDNADSALYLVYRSYMDDKSSMKLNAGNNLLARFKWFMTLQCIQCLNPGYTPRAKISVLVEGACYVGEYCGEISFCAQSKFGIDNVLQTFDAFDAQARSAKWMPPGRFDALMDTPESRYGIHDWHWSRCLYPAPISQGYSTCGKPFTYGPDLCQQLAKTPQR
ncbi:hypothetical protein FOZ60_006975 [Perkinsus olseni]|uniref:GH18 domain-containing protein n=1 Tax=Perkinsus olseni TaxID=32597 RepID=A0A7J6PH52_PEROL|nr:hypothetical protein FOZ60_006975 [Perkinsus olseni]